MAATVHGAHLIELARERPGEALDAAGDLKNGLRFEWRIVLLDM